MSAPIPTAITNTEAIGRVLYTQYVYYFQAAGLVQEKLVAMVGAIVLTLRHKPNIKRQNISDQVARTKETAMEVVKVQPGQGLHDPDRGRLPNDHRRSDTISRSPRSCSRSASSASSSTART